MSDSTDNRRSWRLPDDCAYVADQAAGFALGALEPAERVRVERHVRTCAPCALFVADFEATAGLLPFVAPPAVPSASAKSELFARIASSERASLPRAQVQVQAQAPARPRPVARPSYVAPLPTMLTIPASGAARTAPIAAPVPPKQPVTPVAAASKRWYALGTPLTTIPLVLALVVVSAWSVSLLDRVQTGSERTNVGTELLTTGQSVTTGAEIDTGDGGVQGILGLDGLDDASLGVAAIDTGTDLDLDADADALGFVYGGVDVGATVGTTFHTLQYGDQYAPTGGEVVIG